MCHIKHDDLKIKFIIKRAMINHEHRQDSVSLNLGWTRSDGIAVNDFKEIYT